MTDISYFLELIPFIKARGFYDGMLDILISNPEITTAFKKYFEGVLCVFANAYDLIVVVTTPKYEPNRLHRRGASFVYFATPLKDNIYTINDGAYTILRSETVYLLFMHPPSVALPFFYGDEMKLDEQVVGLNNTILPLTPTERFYINGNVYLLTRRLSSRVCIVHDNARQYLLIQGYQSSEVIPFEGYAGQ